MMDLNNIAKEKCGSLADFLASTSPIRGSLEAACDLVNGGRGRTYLYETADGKYYLYTDRDLLLTFRDVDARTAAFELRREAVSLANLGKAIKSPPFHCPLGHIVEPPDFDHDMRGNRREGCKAHRQMRIVEFSRSAD